MRVNEAGTEIDYTIVDRERALSVGTEAMRLGVTRIEAILTAGLTRPDAEQEIYRGVQKIPDIVRDFKKGIGSGLGRLGTEFLSMFIRNIPVQRHTMNVRVWGHPKSRKGSLEGVAKEICRRVILSCKVPDVIPAADATLHWDMSGKFVNAGMTVYSGPLAQALAGNLVWTWPTTPEIDQVAGYLESNVTIPPGGYPGLSNLSRRGSRGAYIKALSTAALLAPAATPAQPGFPDDAVAREP